MKYIIMCGGIHESFNETPRQLSVVDGEPIVEGTVRKLRELGVDDICISTNTHHFDYLGVPILNHQNNYKTEIINNKQHLVGYWVDAFYPTDEPCCYLMGDTFYSKLALKQIIHTETDDILFFGTQEPFAKGYYKKWEEPLGFKVVNQKRFRECIDKVKQFQDTDRERTHRLPISWELYRVVEGFPIEKHLHGPRFVGVHFFASDIDSPGDVPKLNEALRINRGM